MKTVLKVSVVFLTVVGAAALVHAQGTAFTYQGRLNDNGLPANGSYDLRFILYTADQGGSQVGPILTNAPVSVSSGLFIVTLDFGANIFTGPPRWLEIAVRTNGNASPHTPLTSRQPLTATPYAITAANVAAGGGLSGTYSNAVTFNNAANSFSGSGAGLSGVNATTLGGLSSSAFWKLTGNAGTTPGANFLGTTDNQPLELRVNNVGALRLEPRTTTLSFPQGSIIYSNAPNVVAGASVNRAGPGAVGAVIGGGGVEGVYIDQGAGYMFFGPFANEVSALFGTVGGGFFNRIQTNAAAATISGGTQNRIATNAQNTTIGGGSGNEIDTGAGGAMIGGGQGNWIKSNAFSATITGGFNNTVETNADYATIGGGTDNIILTGGDFGTIPGGYRNSATNYAFAAGYRANAIHTGTFVWADSQEDDFDSTGANQFLIRASGGVGIGTDSPQGLVDVHSGISDTSALFVRADPGTLGRGGVLHHQSSTYAWQELAQFTGSPTDGFLAFHYVNRTAPGTKVTANALVVRGNGSVGIGLIPTFQLQLSTDSAAKPNGGSWANSSDARIKKNIQPLTGALDKLTQLRGVSFEWINPADHANQTGLQAGFIAQEVERVFPNWIQEVPGAEHDARLTPDGRIKSLSLPFEFDALTVEALRELRAENAELKRELQTLKEVVRERDGATLRSALEARNSEIQDLKDRFAALEKLLTNLKGNGN